MLYQSGDKSVLVEINTETAQVIHTVPLPEGTLLEQAPTINALISRLARSHDGMYSIDPSQAVMFKSEQTGSL
jgi:hypothetical protein